MKSNLLSVAKYTKMILLFLVLGAIVLYIAGAPIASYVIAQGNMIIAKSAPGYDEGMDPQLSKLVMERGTIDQSEISVPELDTQYGTITCDRIALSSRVYYGDSEDTLLKGIGQYPNGVLPGSGATFLLSGHDATFFAPLEEIQIGDVLTITKEEATYQYSVSSKIVAEASDTTAYDLSQEKEQMILYTCYPFGQLVGNRGNRFFVYCDPVSITEIDN